MKKSEFRATLRVRKLAPQNSKPFELTVLQRVKGNTDPLRTGSAKNRTDTSVSGSRPRIEERRADLGLGFFLAAHGSPEFTPRQPH
jgi:hypothetical protein